MISRQEFLEQLQRAEAAMPGLPVSSSMVRRLADELAAGEPIWWKNAAKAWQNRRFVFWTEAWGLFLAAVHFEALNDAHHPLIRYFPSCGGTNEADPSLELSRFLSAAPQSFCERLRDGRRRNYIQTRAQLWIGPAMSFFQRRRLSYYVVQVDAGAGLDLAVDTIALPRGFRHDLVAARIGLDDHPLMLEDIGHRRWLTAALLPEQMPFIKSLDAAIENLRKIQSKDGTFVQMMECGSELAPRFIARNIPPEDDMGLLVFNMGSTSRMDDPEYKNYGESMARMMAPWGNRALWLEVESVRGEIYSMTYQVRLHRMSSNGLLSHVMASFDFNARKTSYDQEKTAQFLAGSSRIGQTGS
ncbi:MAG: DUF2332 family protein [Elusimicrobiota bacterium]